METPKEGVIRFGIVGCGRISGFHLEALEALKGIAEVTAVCDVVPERAEAAARKAGGARWYTDLDAMIEAGGLDVLSVCTPRACIRNMASPGPRLDSTWSARSPSGSTCPGWIG